MKVLLCHAYYYNQRGGEDRSFEEERELLVANGHDVIEYVRRNEELAGVSRLQATATAIWNRSAARDVAQLIDRYRPDLFHATNTFPLISPSVCAVAHQRGVAVVQALRNYRLLCANSYLMREGRPCEDCIGRALPWPAIKHRCYRDGAAASAVVAAMQATHRALGVWRNRVDAFFTLTEFARSRFIEAGLPADRIHVKCNSVSPDPGMGSGGAGGVALVGRLSPEKGIRTALEAWRIDPTLPPLTIVGEGPLQSDVEAAARMDARITYRGAVSNVEAQEIIKGATALLMPSVWYETFGRTIAEAFAAGVPVVASRLGAMAELVDDGVNGQLFTAGDARELSRAVAGVVGLSPRKSNDMRRSARHAYEKKFTPVHNYSRLIEIYEIALAAASRRRPQEAPEICRLAVVQEASAQPRGEQTGISRTLSVTERGLL